jgi:hypothetical protein
MIAALVTLPAANTGYTLLELLETATGRSNLNTEYARACSITIQYLGSTDGYIVPNTLAYATTVGDVPDQYGYSFANGGTYWEKVANHNLYALDEIILGVQTANETFAVTVYAT